MRRYVASYVRKGGRYECDQRLARKEDGEYLFWELLRFYCIGKSDSGPKGCCYNVSLLTSPHILVC